MARQPYWATLAYLKMVSFIPLSFYFPHLFLPKSPKSLPFPTFGYPSKHLIKKSCAIPKCSFHASHNVSYSLRQQIPLVWKVIWRAGTIDLILMDFMHGQWGQWQGLDRVSLPQVFNLGSSLSLCLCAPPVLWTFDGPLVDWWLFCDVTGSCQAGFYLSSPLHTLPLSLCAPLWVCRWAFTT